MTERSTLNISQLNLKIGLFNAENLFLLFDHEIPPHFEKMPENQWQKLSGSVYENKPLKKCLQIAALIQENDPDILMFCEVGGLESLHNFNKLFLNSHYSVALIEGNSDRHIDVGYLVKKNLPFYFDLSTNKNRPLQFLYPHEQQSLKTGYPLKNTSQLFSRDCAELRLFGQNREKPFLILLLTHLKSRLDPERIDPGGVERRTAELRTALHIYHELHQTYPQSPIILAGDFNGFAGHPATDPEFMSLYQETSLQDILEIDHVSTDKRSTFFQIKNGGRTEGKQIDYIFLPAELHRYLKPQSAIAYQFKDELGSPLPPPKTLDEKLQRPSDHLPLFFTLEKLPLW